MAQAETTTKEAPKELQEQIEKPQLENSVEAKTETERVVKKDPKPAGEDKKKTFEYLSTQFPVNTKIQLSSFEVFMTFVKKEGSSVDIENVFSAECYNLWLKTRTKELKRPEESFQRTLTSHVRGTDQRKPFPEDIETALLKKLRLKQNWKCFTNLGRYGFRGKGYHEKRAMEKSNEAISKKRKYEMGHQEYSRPAPSPEFYYQPPSHIYYGDYMEPYHPQSNHMPVFDNYWREPYQYAVRAKENSWRYPYFPHPCARP